MTRRWPIFLIGIALGVAASLGWPGQAHASKCESGVFNPITKVRWTCIFPITVGGIRVGSYDKLDKALDEAQARGWTVVDMRRDWKTVFAAPTKQ